MAHRKRLFMNLQFWHDRGVAGTGAETGRRRQLDPSALLRRFGRLDVVEKSAVLADGSFMKTKVKPHVAWNDERHEMSTRRSSCFFDAITVNRVTRSLTILAALLAVPLASGPMAAQTLANQATDPTVLKQIVIFGRHSVRSAVVPSTTLASFASQPYPDFGV